MLIHSVMNGLDLRDPVQLDFGTLPYSKMKTIANIPNIPILQPMGRVRRSASRSDASKNTTRLIGHLLPSVGDLKLASTARCGVGRQYSRAPSAHIS